MDAEGRQDAPRLTGWSHYYCVFTHAHTPAFFLGMLTFEDGTDRISRNVGNGLLDAAQCFKRAKTSTAQCRKYQIPRR